MRVDRVDNVQGPPNPFVWGPLTVPCPWAPEGLATRVNVLSTSLN